MSLPEAFYTRPVKARKVHKCCECKETISVGDEYQYSSGIWDGSPDSFRQCLKCYVVIQAAADSSQFGEDESPSFGNLKGWLRDFECSDYKGQDLIDGLAEDLGVEKDLIERLIKRPVKEASGKEKL